MNVYMTVGMLLLGFLSFILAIVWQRRVKLSAIFTEELECIFGEPDLSGKKQYNDCKCFQWVMNNEVLRNYSQVGESFRNKMMNRTLFTTLVLGMFLGLIPVIVVFILFKAFNLVGTSLLLIFIAMYILRGPGNVEVSSNLLEWLLDQDKSSLMIGDLAYAKISINTIHGWQIKLILLGVLSFMIAPWGEELLLSTVWFFTQFLGWAYESIYLPLSVVSIPLALFSYFSIGPLLFGVILFMFRLIVIKYRS